MADKAKTTIGVVLLNLGGPDSLQSIRPFLYNLFSDREIIRLGPGFLQKPIAWLISCLRAKKAERMYSLIGGKSPIFDITTAQAKALEKALNQGSGVRHQGSEINNSQLATRNSSLSFKVYVGMRYWHPFIADAVKKLLADNIKNIIVLSLYPHYSKATAGSAISEFRRAIEKFRTPNLPAGRLRIQYIDRWYDFPPYIEALADLIYKSVANFASEPACRTGRPVELLYSAHSLPKSFIRQGDPYLDHINATVKAVNSLLATRYLPAGQAGSLPLKWHLSFQSRSGPVKWLQPDTQESIIKIAKTGVKNLLVVPVSFVSDHIETLYEIDILYREIAKNNGINLIRCESLNTSEKFINALKELILKEAER